MNKSLIATGLSRLWAGVLTPVKGLQAAGLDVTLLYREQVKAFTPQQTGIRSIRVSSNLLLQTWVFLREVLARKPRHVEFYFHSGCWRALRLQAQICNWLKIPIVCVCTGSELLDFQTHGKAKADCIRAVFASARAVILKELYMRDVIRRFGLIDEKRTHLISNRVHVGAEPEPAGRAPVVLFLNLYKRFRRLDLIVAAVPLVRAVVPDVRFLLVGSGRYPEYEVELAEQAASLGIGDGIEFLPFTQEAGSYFAEASIFLLPADIVFCNNALLEAMERAVPPIVADVDGAERIVEDGVNGLRVPQTAEAIAAAVIRLCTDEALRLQMAHAARRSIVEKFDERQRTAELLGLYEAEVWSR